MENRKNQKFRSLKHCKVRFMNLCVDATIWSNYKIGIFNNFNKNIYHAVLVVGYNTSGNWIIKNS
ncbi:unnamed protein product [Paramecium octaurelia]|uniref:Peptidase C1A papain C-terminal domain-containing protein n=1 Tax=Paramecium octaurelia TaxID=43137 RepID=A0A8S1UN93_PAROT|nr:unnamed protein product [Paramecium octaurelia]